MAKCNSCGGDVVLTKNGTYRCRSCGAEVDTQEYSSCAYNQGARIQQTGGEFRKPLPPVERKPAKCPCPRCHATSNVYIENNLFVCDNCGFVEGDKV